MWWSVKSKFVCLTVRKKEKKKHHSAWGVALKKKKIAVNGVILDNQHYLAKLCHGPHNCLTVQTSVKHVLSNWNMQRSWGVHNYRHSVCMRERERERVCVCVCGCAGGCRCSYEHLFSRSMHYESTNYAYSSLFALFL